MFPRVYTDHVCLDCKVFVSTESERALAFRQAHSLCDLQMLPHWGRDGRVEPFVSNGFANFDDDLDDGGRREVLRKLIERYTKHLECLRSLYEEPLDGLDNP